MQPLLILGPKAKELHVANDDRNVKQHPTKIVTAKVTVSAPRQTVASPAKSKNFHL